MQMGSDKYISLSCGHKCYSDTNMDVYLEEIKKELELRIPDKYLIANGWM